MPSDGDIQLCEIPFELYYPYCDDDLLINNRNRSMLMSFLSVVCCDILESSSEL
jgi:hypothetical protein